MHLAVLGATGRLGRVVVDRALTEGHGVTALADIPGAITEAHHNLTVHSVDMLRPDSLDVLEGVDAVVFAVEPSGRKTTTMCSEGMTSVVRAMSAHGVKRITAVSRSAVEISPHASLSRKIALRFLVHKISRNPLLDLERMENELYHSELDWTVVRSSTLREGPANGRYRVELGSARGREHPVTTGNLAEYLVEYSTHDQMPRSVVTVVGSG